MRIVLPVSRLVLRLESGADNGLLFSCREAWDEDPPLVPVAEANELSELRTRRSPSVSWVVALGSFSGPGDLQLRYRRRLGWASLPVYRVESTLWWAELPFAVVALQLAVDGQAVDVPLRGAGLPVPLPQAAVNPAT